MHSKIRLRALAVTLALLCLFTISAYSQEPTVDAQTKDQLKTIMAHLLETIYVSPEIGKHLAVQLTAKFESGAYKDAATGTQLATALTRDLRILGKDKHLNVRYDPAASGGNILTLQEWETRRSSMFQMRGPGPQSPGNARMAEQLQKANYNFREAKYLGGNVGYLDLGGFAPGAAARDAAARAMATLADSDAMIIDLRRCPGGSGEMVNFLASYFFDQEPRVLMSRFIRPTGETIQSRTIADIPGKRMLDTDLYVLIGPNTASACESFSYTLQQFGRAKVVGEPSAGAGYNNVFIPLGKGYIFSVSYGRPIHPRSGKGWEGEGVQPDIAVRTDDALEAAHRESLQKLISKTSDENRKKDLTSALQNVSSRGQSPTGGKAGDEAIVKELTTFFEQLVASDAFSGAVILAKDDKPIFQKAFGLANKITNTPNKTDTKFNLGSLNKMFTAVAIAQLVERGKLSFTDPVGKLLPDYPNRTVAEKVTIHQLLTHTSGMGDYDYVKASNSGKVSKTASDLLPLFANNKLAFEPGSKWQYSNAGYALLGVIIEKASGQNYYEYVREHIFKPAGMMNTDSYERGMTVSNLAIGYTRANDAGRADPSLPRRENTPPAKGSPAGGGYSTVEDLLRFSVALRSHKLLNQKYTEIVMSGKVEVGPPLGKYAYGFGDKVFNGRRIVGHNGGAAGIGANFDMFPELGYTAIVMTNYDAPAMMPVLMKLRGLVPENSSLASSPGQQNPSASQKIHGQTLSQSEQEVRKLEREWLDAYEKYDLEAMNRIVADEFKLTRSNGSVQTKADIIAELKTGRETSRPAMKFLTEDVQSRVEGESVILSGRVIMQSASGMSMQARYTDTYARRNGRWQVVSSQMARLPQ
jgi:CubicO group peptidase (beta-lactamase class C family)